MTMTVRRKRIVRYAIVYGITLGLLVIVLGFISVRPVPEARAAWGSGGGGTGGSGIGYWTSNGFGWKKFLKTSSGPSGGFANGTAWSSVQSACSEYSSDSVWVHVVRNNSGGERSFNYEGASYNRDRPAAGSDPYMFNANGQYAPQGAAYQQHVINIVNAVHAAFNVAEPGAGWAWGDSVAWFCDGSKQLPWTIRAESYIKKVGPSAPLNSTTGFTQPSTALTATPGETISWAHDLRVQSANLDRRVYWTLRGTGFPDSFRQTGQSWSGPTTLLHSNVAPPVANGTLFVRLGSYSGGNASYTVRTVTQDDVGKSLCQRIEWQPYAWNNANAGATTYRCADVPYNYALTPTIAIIGDGAVVNADNVPTRAEGTVQNAGPTKSHTGIEWRITQLEYRPNATGLDPGGTRITSNDACHFFSSANRSSCVEIGGAGSSVSFNQGQTRSAFFGNGERTEQPAGTRICFVMSVKRNSSLSTGTGWRHSEMKCMVIGKSPKVQVHGGDVQVGRVFTGGSLVNSNVNTSKTVLNGASIPVSESRLSAAARATQRYWVLGDKAKLDFGVTTQMCAGKPCLPSSGTVPVAVSGKEGITVATNKDGTMQFYTDGQKAYRASDGSVIASNLGGTGTTTQAAALFPLSNSRYMVVTSSAQAEYGIKGKIQYSIIDMKTGGGTLVSGPQVLGSDTSAYIGEALSVAPSATEDSYWVVVNRAGTNNIVSFEVPYDFQGSIRQTAVSTSGHNSGGTAPGFGTVNFNKDYSKMVITNATTRNIRVGDFSRVTGRFTETHHWMPTHSNPGSFSSYSADFSPSGTYIYHTALYTEAGQVGVLYRYKADGSDAQLIATMPIGSGQPSGASGGGQVKRAPDGRMYVANYGRTNIGVIDDPDNPDKNSIGWNSTGRSLQSTSRFGLPQTVAIVRAYLEDPPQYDKRIFGSWAEYGIFAPALITSMSSGSGLNAESGHDSDLQSSWSPYTFTKKTGTNNYGSYTTPNTKLPDVTSVFPVATATAVSFPASSLNLSATAKNRVIKPATGATTNLTLTANAGITLNNGQWLVVNAIGHNITIDRDLRYANGPFANINQIPQLIIIADNITINENVTNVDAWLVAKNDPARPTTAYGAIATCNQRVRWNVASNTNTISTNATAQWLAANYTRANTDGNSPALTIGTCDKLLQINGPIIANKLYLRRTAGSGTGTAAGDPAEIINLRPDTYLWVNYHMNTNGAYRTMTVTELPPRY